MKKKLLVYKWGSLSEPLLCRAMKDLGWDCVEYARQMTNYHADALFAREFMECIHTNGIQMVFSYDYFPLISMICEINKIPYVAWIYDCPLYTLQSKTLTGKYNYIFCFDRVYAERLKAIGAVHCYHYPLAGTRELFEKTNKKKAAETLKYQCDISFVGNLYNEKKNRLRQAELSDYTKGFAQGLMQAQLLVYGYNFLRESLPESVCREILQKCKISLGDEYIQDEFQMAADAVGMEVTGRERELVLLSASNRYLVRLYTSSEMPDELRIPNIKNMGAADYETEVPFIYQNSRINLNVTSKTIESGIPQRVFDILSCGGFCMTNYQPEIAEYFADGQELVMYSDMKDLSNKVEYYLTHEDERKQIAQNGCRKVLREFELGKRIAVMLEIVERDAEG